MSPRKQGAARDAAHESEPSFEESLERIEEIVERLESGDLSLDESLALFQEGVTLSRRCQKTLDEAERKIEELVKLADGSLALEPLDPGLDPDDDTGV